MRLGSECGQRVERYRVVAAAVVAGALLAGLAGCERPAPQPPREAVSTEEIIRRNANAPVGQSIEPVARSLAKRTVFVASDSAPSTERGAVTQDRLRFRTAHDNQGRLWAYAYTAQAELSRAFPQGSPYVELDFGDFLGIIDGDARFAGIFLDSGSDASYPIPREVFEKAREVLRQSGDGRSGGEYRRRW